MSSNEFAGESTPANRCDVAVLVPCYNEGRAIAKVCYSHSCRICPNNQCSSRLHLSCGRNDSLASFASRRVRGLNGPDPRWTRFYQQRQSFIWAKLAGDGN